MGRHTLPPRHKVVDEKDVDEVRKLAQADSRLPEGRHQLHLLLQNYVLDDARVATNPLELPARHIQANMLSIHTPEASLDAMQNAVEDASIEVRGHLFSALCAARAVLTAEQKANGVLLIHLGGGTTSYIAFANGIGVIAGSFGVGGEHVTKDIQQAFHLMSEKAAETMKRSGSATVDGVVASERGNIPSGESLMEERDRTFSARSLSVVINARYDETLRIVHGLMESSGVLPKLGSGVVLTGGPAYQRNLPPLVSRIFKMPCAVGSVPELSGLGEGQPATLAAVFGALQIVDEDLQKQENLDASGGGFWSRVKGGRS